VPGKKMMGYKKGGSLDMVEKDGKKVPFYAADGKGKMAEGGKVKKKKKVKAPGKTKTAKGKSLKELDMKPSGPSKNPAKAPMPTAKNNTMPVPKPQAAPPSAPKPPMGGMGGAPKPPMGGMGGAPKPPMGGAPGGMGAMMKPNMGAPKPPMMKKGGKVKKGGSCGGYKKGGTVRGAGIARQGVKQCKMR